MLHLPFACSAVSLDGQGLGGHFVCPYPKLHALPSHRTRRIGIWGSWRISHRHLVAQFHARMDLLELCARVFAYEAIEPPSHTRAHALVGAQMLRLSDVKKAAMHKWKTEQALQTEITRRKDTVSSL